MTLEIIDKILNLYLSLEYLVNLHFYKFSFSFVLASIFWVSLVGIVTPVWILRYICFVIYTCDKFFNKFFLSHKSKRFDSKI